MTNVSKRMVYERCRWVAERSGLPLVLEESPLGWFVHLEMYKDDKFIGRKEICCCQDKRALFAALRGMYELLLAMDEQYKHKQLQQHQGIDLRREELR